MIRINLLAVERERAKKKAVTFQTGQKLTIGCSLILILAVLFVGWRYLDPHAANPPSSMPRSRPRSRRPRGSGRSSCRCSSSSSAAPSCSSASC